VTRHPESILTWANLVTAVRTAGCIAIFAVAASRSSAAWNLAGLGLYWLLDMLDGHLARRLQQETRFGAQFDILSDRLLVALFYMNHLAWHHELVLPIALFLVQFMLLDHYLSNQFLRWNILSPNYFYLVDSTVWRLNWSPLAKLGNSGAVTVLIIVAPWPWLSIAASLAIIAIKVYSLLRIMRLTPEAAWSAPSVIR
jgi:phosphatidylglycerophosphate synthase